MRRTSSITIDMPDSLQLLMHYDHGEGIYPIRPEGHLTGFMDLSEGARSRLNDYFNSLGYDEEDLGITH